MQRLYPASPAPSPTTREKGVGQVPPRTGMGEGVRGRGSMKRKTQATVSRLCVSVGNLCPVSMGIYVHLWFIPARERNAG